MQFSTGTSAGGPDRSDAIAELFTRTFTRSEGADEGQLVGALARDLMAMTASDDIHVFTAEEAGVLIGAAIFSRLSFPDDARTAFVLSPMAVSTAHQRKGVGQALLTHALAELRAGGVDLAFTYGDPNYYRQVGFQPISEEQARAPLPLSMPHGWLGQALTAPEMAPVSGPSTCVAALHRPELW